MLKKIDVTALIKEMQLEWFTSKFGREPKSDVELQFIWDWWSDEVELPDLLKSVTPDSLQCRRAN